MIRIIQTEFKKLKRFHILIVGFIGMAFPSILAVFTQTVASSGTDPNFDFNALFDSSIWNSVTIFMPIIFTLIGGYIINREYIDDTLKNIFPIPLGFKKLISGKLLTMGLLSLFFGLYSFFVTIIVGKVCGIGGLNNYILIDSLIKILGIAICVYIAVLPIIAFTCRREGMYLGGVILSFVLGYSAMFIKDSFIRSLYPISAGFTVVGFDTSTFMNVSEANHIGLSLLSLAISLFITVAIIASLDPEKTKQKRKKKNKDKKNLFERGAKN